MRFFYTLSFRFMTAIVVFLLTSNLCFSSHQRFHFNISKQPLNNALLQFASITQLQFIFESDDVRELYNSPLHGEFTVQEALRHLLQHTHFGYQFISDNTVTLVFQGTPSDTKNHPLPAADFDPNTKVLLPLQIMGHTYPQQHSVNPHNRYHITHTHSATRTSMAIQHIPQSIQALPEQLILDQQSLTISESLRNVSGVSVAPMMLTPSFDYTRIRGLHSEQLLDGFTQYYNPGDRESLVNVAHIEVLKGSNALLYGGGSGSPAGGLVNIVSKMPHSENHYKFGLKYGTYQFYQPWLDINLATNTDFQFRLTAEYTNTDSHIDRLNNQRFNVNPSLRWSINETSLLTVQAKLSHWQQADYQGLPATGTITGNFSIPKTTFIGPDSIEPSQAYFYGIWATLKHAFNQHWSLSARVRHAQSKFDQKVQALAGTDGVQADLPLAAPATWSLFNAHLRQHQQEISTNAQLLGEWAFKNSQHSWLFGVDFSLYEDSGFINFDTIPVALVDLRQAQFLTPFLQPEAAQDNVFVDNTTYGFYTQWQASWFSRLHTLAGLRLGHVSIDYLNQDPGFNAHSVTRSSKFLPRLGVNIDLTADLTAFFVYSQGMRGQPFFNFKHAPQPEFNAQLESGLKFNLSDNLNGQLAFYQIQLENVAVTDTSDIQQRADSNGKQRSQGIELDLNWQALSNLNVLFNVAYSDARQLSQHNGLVANSPIIGSHQYSTRGWIDYRFIHPALQGFSVGGGIYAQTGTTINVPGISRSPGFYSVDAVLRYQSPHFNVSLSGKNLSNESYFESINYFGGRFAPTQPRSIFASFSIHY